jgi:hypothetical protein
MGTAIGRYESQTDIRAKAAAYNIAAEASTAWTWSPSRPPRAAPLATPSARPGGPFPGMQHLPLPRAFHVRRPALPRQDEVATWRAKGPSCGSRGWLLENGLIHEERRREIEARSMPRSRRPWSSPRPARGSRWRTLTNHVLGPPARAGPPGRAIGRDGRDDLSRGGQAGDPRRDDPRRARVPHGRGRGRLWRLLRGVQGADGRVRRGSHPRHAAVGIGLHRGRASVRRRRGCGPSWS